MGDAAFAAVRDYALTKGSAMAEFKIAALAVVETRPIKDSLPEIRASVGVPSLI